LCSATCLFVLHAYEADFLQGLFKNKERKLSQTFNSSFRYLDDVLSLNNSQFGDYLHRIYPNEIQVKDTTDNQKLASYLDLHLEIANEGRLKTKLYDKCGHFTFQIANFPFNQYQYSSITNVRSLHSTTHTLF
jgi:hypothetical protein